MFTVFGIIFFALVAKISRYVSLASLIGMAMFFVEFLIWGFLGWLPLSGTSLVEGTVIVFALAALAFIRHRSNIVRLVHGTERKIGEKRINFSAHMRRLEYNYGKYKCFRSWKLGLRPCFTS